MASITRRRSRSWLADSWSPKGVRFPLRTDCPSVGGKIPTPHENYRRAARPLRPERDRPNSITTMRRQIGVALANGLPQMLSAQVRCREASFAYHTVRIAALFDMPLQV